MEQRIVLCDPDRLKDLFEFRARVWIGEGVDPLAFPDGAWSDAADAHRIHWTVLDDRRIVGAASTCFHATLAEVEEPEAYILLPTPPAGVIAVPARVVVDPAYRGRGIAAALLDTQDQAARDAGAGLAVRQASPAMARILERRGWRDHGPAPADPRFPTTAFRVMSLLLDGAL
ncbi:MAG: hypothetical protein CVT67_04975 [Actinobacteria bacterium HGW-Actinobacteria-7]|nr:MAG: hypothetical protein CVT67_04975 [Actinobacteria bacterium HGW-Actinobacteria-7]